MNTKVDSCKHDPDVLVNTVGTNKTTKCLKCKQHIMSIANSRWMTNTEYRVFILQEHHGSK